MSASSLSSLASDVTTWQAAGFLTEDERSAINVRVAHLTYLRPHEHDWAIGRMIRLALETIAAFIKAVGTAGHDGWDYRRSEVERTLADWGDRGGVRTNNDRHAHR